MIHEYKWRDKPKLEFEAILKELKYVWELNECLNRTMTLELNEIINTESLPTHLRRTQNRVLLCRIIRSCYNGKKDFEDVEVVFRILFEKFWKHQNFHLCSRER